MFLSAIRIAGYRKISKLESELAGNHGPPRSVLAPRAKTSDNFETLLSCWLDSSFADDPAVNLRFPSAEMPILVPWCGGAGWSMAIAPHREAVVAFWAQ
jgi:hypothetical protein